jgi:hypothetical protein
MPITQEPTLQPIDIQHNQFQVQFGVRMEPGENSLPVTVPNIGQLTADVFTIDFSKVNVPARGNFPDFRSLQFCLQVDQVGTGAASVGAVYIVNPRTSQVIPLLSPMPTLTRPSIIYASIPFFAKSNQSVLLYRAESVLSVASLSATAYTYDTDSYFAIMDPNTI